MDDIYGWKYIKKGIEFIMEEAHYQRLMTKVRNQLIKEGHKVPYVLWYKHYEKKYWFHRSKIPAKKE
jgi:hypothetical protein